MKKDKKHLRLPFAFLQLLYAELKPLTPQQRMEKFSLKVEYIYVSVAKLLGDVINYLFTNGLFSAD